MEIKHLLVNEIEIEQSSLNGVSHACLYTFDGRQWVSPHRETPGKRIGPVTLLADADWNGLGIQKKDFGIRKLHSTADNSTIGYPAVSYRSRWTIPDASLYTFVLPIEYVAVKIDITTHRQDDYPLLMGVTKEGNLFYHTMFADGVIQHQTHVFDMVARLEYDKEKWEKSIADSEIVEGTKHYDVMVKNALRFLGPELLKVAHEFLLASLKK